MGAAPNFSLGDDPDFMANQFQTIYEQLKQILPRRSSSGEREVETSTVVLTDAESKIVEQTAQTEKKRWAQIVEVGVPTSMLVVGGLLAGFAELIGVWALFGFVLVAASPIVYWQQRIEKQLKEMTDELRRSRSIRR